MGGPSAQGLLSTQLLQWLQGELSAPLLSSGALALRPGACLGCALQPSSRASTHRGGLLLALCVPEWAAAAGNLSRTLGGGLSWGVPSSGAQLLEMERSRDSWDGGDAHRGGRSKGRGFEEGGLSESGGLFQEGGLSEEGGLFDVPSTWLEPPVEVEAELLSHAQAECELLQLSALSAELTHSGSHSGSKIHSGGGPPQPPNAVAAACLTRAGGAWRWRADALSWRCHIARNELHRAHRGARLR